MGVIRVIFYLILITSLPDTAGGEGNPTVKRPLPSVWRRLLFALLSFIFALLSFIFFSYLCRLEVAHSVARCCELAK